MIEFFEAPPISYNTILRINLLAITHLLIIYIIASRRRESNPRRSTRNGAVETIHATNLATGQVGNSVHLNKVTLFVW